MQVNKNIAIPAAVGVGSLSLGFAAGYFFHKWRLEKSVREFMTDVETYEDEQLSFTFDEVSNGALERAKEHHPAMRATQRLVKDPNQPEIVTDVVIEETDEELIITFDDHDTVPEAEVVSIFTNAEEDPDWNYEEEIARRELQPERPHIIHIDEFFESAGNDYRQHQLTYYAGDNILCDDNNVPMYNAKEVVGEIAESFGHGSNDQNLLFVRNTVLDSEYEIIRDPGHYAVEVLGAEIEDGYETGDLKHSHSPHKFRE